MHAGTLPWGLGDGDGVAAGSMVTETPFYSWQELDQMLDE
jgi:hypothetical protein